MAVKRAFRGVALLALLVSAAPAHAATAKEMYASALARQQALHELPPTGRSAPTASQYRAAIAAFEAVVRRHPTSGYADNALWEGGRLALEARDRLGEARHAATAKRLLTWLLDEYPASPLVRRAREEIRRADAAPPALSRAAVREPAALPAAVNPPPVDPGEPADPRAVVLRDIRRTIADNVVRIVVQLDAEVTYRTERLDHPARVLFDLSPTRLGPAVAEGTVTYTGDVVRRVRVGRHPKQVTRVVLDIDGVERYSVFTLYDPYRIVVDCERGRTAPSAPVTAEVAPVARERIAEEPPVVLPPPDAEELAPAPLEGRRIAIPRTLSPAAPGPSRTILPGKGSADEAESGRAPRAPSAATVPAVTPSAASRPSAEPISPEVPAEPPAAGYSLARQLGLGASRIVIDPGHGGHDPGAKGPGIWEAAVVLDIALRLEKLLRATGIEAVLTRRTDVYVPLEERTAIANRHQGDLFLSIHANASRKRTARGVETYVLNFASNPEAEAVAARENAATGRTMSSLTDMVKAIALNNKLDESRSLAGQVQREMVQRLSDSNRGLRNNGIRQAPFVVLIGAAMPSVLVEVSFITHSQEGRLLKSGSYRQKIAEALAEGVRGYQRSLKGTGVPATQ